MSQMIKYVEMCYKCLKMFRNVQIGDKYSKSFKSIKMSRNISNVWKCTMCFITYKKKVFLQFLKKRNLLKQR